MQLFMLVVSLVLASLCFAGSEDESLQYSPPLYSGWHGSGHPYPDPSVQRLSDCVNSVYGQSFGSSGALSKDLLLQMKSALELGIQMESLETHKIKLLLFYKCAYGENPLPSWAFQQYSFPHPFLDKGAKLAVRGFKHLLASCE